MHALALIRWVVSVVFGLSGWWIIILNFSVVYFRFVRRKRTGSWVPFLGGFLAFVGMVFCPLPQIQKYAWTPLIVDAGYIISVMTIGYIMQYFARRKNEDA